MLQLAPGPANELRENATNTHVLEQEQVQLIGIELENVLHRGASFPKNADCRTQRRLGSADLQHFVVHKEVNIRSLIQALCFLSMADGYMFSTPAGVRLWREASQSTLLLVTVMRQ